MERVRSRSDLCPEPCGPLQFMQQVCCCLAGHAAVLRDPQAHFGWRHLPCTVHLQPIPCGCPKAVLACCGLANTVAGSFMGNTTEGYVGVFTFHENSF